MQQFILRKLFALRDEKYRRFQSALMPTVSPETVIGVRTPLLRRLAKELKNGTEAEAEAEAFLQSLPHKYYEENNLHALLIMQLDDFDRCIAELDCFLPYVDNWATCDMLRPKCFRKHREALLPKIQRWLASDNTFTIRFGIEMLMSHFLDECFEEKYLETVGKIQSEEYYVNMAVAWFFAEALAKQYDFAVRFIEENRLSEPVHNMTIQKAVDSLRISPEKKEYLRNLRLK